MCNGRPERDIIVIMVPGKLYTGEMGGTWIALTEPEELIFSQKNPYVPLYKTRVWFIWVLRSGQVFKMYLSSEKMKRIQKLA